MQAFIEYKNSIVLPLDILYFNSDIEKVYYEYYHHKMGFNKDKNFFIDDNIYNYDIQGDIIKIISNKNTTLDLITKKNEVVYNIGFTTKEAEYILSLSKNSITITTEFENKQRMVKVIK